MEQFPPWAQGVDPNVPNAARIYSGMLGDDENLFPADRAAVKIFDAQMPDFRPTVRENRYFLHRVLRYLLGMGVRQFLDVGTGLPTQGNVHEIVGAHRNDAKVVYVDHDPVVLSHARALMTDSDQVRIVEGDARQPDSILTHPDVRDYLDWNDRIAVLMFGLLHFISDADGAYDVVERFKAPLVPGSYVAISHGTVDGLPTPEWMETVNGQYDRTTTPTTMRTHSKIFPFFAGCEMVEPGLVNVMHWRPDGKTAGLLPSDIRLYGGVGRIQARAT